MKKAVETSAGRIVRLSRLIGRIDELLAEVDRKIGPDPGWKSAGENWRAYQQREAAALDELRKTLTAEEGASFRDQPGSNHFLRLGGVSSSCTSGTLGLLRNWQAAARRAIAREVAE